MFDVSGLFKIYDNIDKMCNTKRCQIFYCVKSWRVLHSGYLSKSLPKVAFDAKSCYGFISPKKTHIIPLSTIHAILSVTNFSFMLAHLVYSSCRQNLAWCICLIVVQPCSTRMASHWFAAKWDVNLLMNYLMLLSLVTHIQGHFYRYWQFTRSIISLVNPNGQHLRGVSHKFLA